MKQKTKSAINREIRVNAFVNDLLVHCAQSKRFPFAMKAAEHKIGGTTYRAIQKYVKETENPKVYSWNTALNVNQITSNVTTKKECNTSKKRGKDAMHSNVTLEIPTKATKVEVGKTIQTKMSFMENKIIKPLPNRNTTITVSEEAGGNTKSITYTVDSSKFLFKDIDESIKRFSNVSS